MGINTYDDFALEEAVQQKEKTGADKVLFFSVDNKKKQIRISEMLWQKVVMNCSVADATLDNADAFTIAKVLAAAIKEEEVDVLFCGNYRLMEKILKFLL